MEEMEQSPPIQDISAVQPVFEPAPSRGYLRHVFSAMALVLCLGAVIGQLVPSLLVTCFPSFQIQAHSFLLGGLTVGLFTLPLMLLVTRRFPARQPEKRRLSPGGFLTLVCVGYAAMLLGNLLGIAVNLLLSPRSVNLVSQLITATGTDLEMVLSFVVLAPVCEELVFRKILVDRVLPYGEWPAILFSGLCFGLFHGNVAQFFYTTLLGMMLSYVYLRTGRILYPMAIHACLNFLGGVLPMLIPSAAYGLLAVAAAGAVLFFLNMGRIHVARNAVPGAGSAMIGNVGTILFILFSGTMMLLVAVVLNHPEWTKGLLQ